MRSADYLTINALAFGRLLIEFRPWNFLKSVGKLFRVLHLEPTDIKVPLAVVHSARAILAAIGVVKRAEKENPRRKGPRTKVMNLCDSKILELLLGAGNVLPFHLGKVDSFNVDNGFY